MFRTDVAADLRAAHEEDGFLFPDYGGYCFAGVPATALSVLGAGDVFEGRDVGPLPDDVFEGVDTDVENVVVALVDGYGFRQYRRDRPHDPFLDLLADRGTVTPLTSIYPSETAAAVTTMHAGLLPSAHGLLGWDQYVDGADAVVQTLPFETGDGEDAGDALGLDPRSLFDGDPFYDRVAAAGVDPVGVFPEGLADTAYSGVAMSGLDVRDAWNPADAGVQARRALAEEGPTYCLAYFPEVDGAAHRAGTESDRYRAQLRAVTEAIRREVVEALDPDVAERTLLVVTADHGEVDTVPADNVGLREERFDPLWDALRRDGDGDPIPPVGGSRNLQLHLRDGTVEATRDLLAAELDCLTVTREEALARDLYGPGERGEAFRRRLPDLTVVPRDRSVWYEAGKLAYVGMHGGLHPDEMLVPFGAATVSTLQS